MNAGHAVTRAVTSPLTSRRFVELLGIAAGIIGVWIVVGLFAASEFYRRTLAGGGAQETLVNVLRFQMVTSLVWATFTPFVIAVAERLPLCKPHLVRNALASVVFLPYLAVFRAVFGGVVLNLSERDPVSMKMMWLSIGIRTHRNIAIGAMLVILTNLVIARREAATRAQRELAAQTLLARAQLDELRAQMQPHFLFLTLGTIAEVVHSDPAAADDMIVGLADLLRRSLALGTDPIPIFEELDFADRYLALYRVCLGGRLAVRFDADEHVLAAFVPPLLIQQLVESAVVNGIEPRGGGELAIHAWCDGERLRLEVRDGGADVVARDDERSLAPVRARLEKLFGTRQSLTVNRDADGVVVALTMPLEIALEIATERALEPAEDLVLETT
jgi:hypothetical protein